MQTRPTEFEAQLIEFLRGVPAVAHKISLGMSTNSNAMVVYVLPAQLLEESGLVNRDSGHGGEFAMR